MIESESNVGDKEEVGKDNLLNNRRPFNYLENCFKNSERNFIISTSLPCLNKG